jgi:transposase-like protein
MVWPGKVGDHISSRSQGHDIRQPLQVGLSRRPDHLAVHALVSALLLSYRDLEEMMAERDLKVDHTTLYRWVQKYSPALEKRCKPHLKQTNDSWRVDETYSTLKGEWMYLHRAVDSADNTLEFLLSEIRGDAQTANGFWLGRLMRAIPPLLG